MPHLLQRLVVVRFKIAYIIYVFDTTLLKGYGTIIIYFNNFKRSKLYSKFQTCGLRRPQRIRNYKIPNKNGKIAEHHILLWSALAWKHVDFLFWDANSNSFRVLADLSLPKRTRRASILRCEQMTLVMNFIILFYF